MAFLTLLDLEPRKVIFMKHKAQFMPRLVITSTYFFHPKINRDDVIISFTIGVGESLTLLVKLLRKKGCEGGSSWDLHGNGRLSTLLSIKGEEGENS